MHILPYSLLRQKEYLSVNQKIPFTTRYFFCQEENLVEHKIISQHENLVENQIISQQENLLAVNQKILLSGRKSC